MASVATHICPQDAEFGDALARDPEVGAALVEEAPHYEAPPAGAGATDVAPAAASQVHNADHYDMGEAAESAFHGEGGTIIYYARSGNFSAVCDNPLHGRCILTRTSKPSRSAARAGQGRPLGHLAAWLACNDQVGGHAEHMSFVPSHVERVHWRGLYRDSAGWRYLETCERGRREGESSEPEMVP